MSASSSVSDFVTVRGVQLHVRRWGRPDAPTLFMLHGWMDVSASFQFVVDALAGDWQVIAPDARGFVVRLAGRAAGRRSLLVPRVPGRPRCARRPLRRPAKSTGRAHGRERRVPVCARGRSACGAWSISRVSGWRPRGPSRRRAGCAAGWTSCAHRPCCALCILDDVARLIKTNPRLDPRRVAFLAAHWSKRGDDGQYHLLADPRTRCRAQLYRLDEVMAPGRRCAKVLHVEAVNSPTLAHIAGDIPLPEFKARFNAFPDWREKLVEDAGHMVHHDQPEQIAALIEAFCA